MGKSKVIGFDAAKLEKDMMNYCVDFQTKELTTYAEDKCREIGDKINSFHSKHNLDRTGNLLNSLCWGVTYNNELKGSGFYREAVTRAKTTKWGEERGFGFQGTQNSALHEFSYDMSEPVYGRQFAEEFLNGKVPSGKNKWKVFFAILAPYWGYWETGFDIKAKRRDGTEIFYTSMKFAVMTQTYDEVKRELKNPKEMTLTITKDMFYTFRPTGEYIKGRYKLNKLGR